MEGTPFLEGNLRRACGAEATILDGEAMPKKSRNGLLPRRRDTSWRRGYSPRASCNYDLHTGILKKSSNS